MRKTETNSAAVPVIYNASTHLKRTVKVETDSAASPLPATLFFRKFFTRQGEVNNSATTRNYNGLVFAQQRRVAR